MFPPKLAMGVWIGPGARHGMAWQYIPRWQHLGYMDFSLVVAATAFYSASG